VVEQVQATARVRPAQRNGRDLPIAANSSRGRNFRKTVPEASNFTRLRAFIHGVHAYAEEHEVQRCSGIR
jgi:hypothetical protein